jgi:hypothetical protein
MAHPERSLRSCDIHLPYNHVWDVGKLDVL